jgi:Transcriptional regulator PadR-like family
MPTRQRAVLLQGTLDLLILKALSTGALHGLGVSRRIEQMTGGTFVVQPGSLFPALHRLEEAGWLASKWDASDFEPVCSGSILSVVVRVLADLAGDSIVHRKGPALPVRAIAPRDARG